MANYNTLINFNGDGATTDFSIPFNYASKSDVKVLRQNGTVSYSWISPNVIRLSAPLAVGDILTIKRETNIANPSVSFVNGAVPTAQQFNSAFSQNLFAAQEANDTANRGLFKDVLGRFDATGSRIINAADPVNAQDVVTKNWAETSGTSFVAQTIQATATALVKAEQASQSATTAASMATNATASATAASTSATSAAAAATSAASSRDAAVSSASTASTKATEASASATSAAASATTATTKAADASTAASAANASAISASNSASSANASATNSNVVAVGTDLAGYSLEPSRDLGLITDSATPGTPSAKGNIQTVAENISSVTNVSTHMADVINAASIAATITTNATNAQTAATNASSSATAAASSATSASTSASTATTKASQASTSATNAATSETNAAASATAAASSATSAATSATNTSSTASRFILPKTANPTTRDGGGSLVAGDTYFNSVAGEMRIYTGTVWQAMTAQPDTMVWKTFTATAGQTSYSYTGGYRVGALFIYVNGVLLSSSDYTATDGTTITFTSALSAGDEVSALTLKAVGSILATDISGLGTLATKSSVSSSDLASSLDLGVMP